MKTKLAVIFFSASLAAACGEGEQGPAGEQGARGPAGPAGATGPAGNDGTNGTNGTDGTNGTNGMNGQDLTRFDFRTDDPSTYTRVDRMGMPAVSTALAVDKDAYNAADPNDDVTPGPGGLPMFVESDIAGALAGLHDALGDDLVGAGLTACADTSGGMTNILPCATQTVGMGGPTVLSLVVPDTLTIDATAAAGFPNGRRLADPVMDVTLSIILLDLTVHGPTTLVGVLNPAANDVPFDASFPYLAYPHVN